MRTLAPALVAVLILAGCVGTTNDASLTSAITGTASASDTTTKATSKETANTRTSTPGSPTTTSPSVNRTGPFEVTVKGRGQGIFDGECGIDRVPVASGDTAIEYVFPFVSPGNATTLSITAEWVADNPTIEKLYLTAVRPGTMPDYHPEAYRSFGSSPLTLKLESNQLKELGNFVEIQLLLLQECEMPGLVLATSQGYNFTATVQGS